MPDVVVGDSRPYPRLMPEAVLLSHVRALVRVDRAVDDYRRRLKAETLGPLRVPAAFQGLLP
jgi:hypothetical protein